MDRNDLLIVIEVPLSAIVMVTWPFESLSEHEA